MADPLTGALILVVDDNEIVRDFARRTLERRGYRVVAAQGARDAVQAFQPIAESVALVLLDVILPDVDARDAVRRLREVRPDVKLILWSGSDEGEARRRTSGERVDGFIQKPCTAEELASRVTAYLSKGNPACASR
jgi:CheY-like chemotaxis protein